MAKYLEIAAGFKRSLNWDAVRDVADPEKGVEKYDMRNLPMKGISDNTYDGVYSEHFIEHLHKSEGIDFLKEMYRVLKPGGTIRTIWPPREFVDKLLSDEQLTADEEYFCAHYHNFYDSLISSNRSDIIEMDYHFNTSFINENLGITGKLSLLYLAGNHSDYYFDYFRNMPVSNNTTHYNDSYNIGLDLDISIADVLLTIRLKNALHRLPIDGDYSISNAELFNPMNSLLSFGIIWEFDD